MMLRETCPCGAEFEGPANHVSTSSLMREFRVAHEACREAAAKDLERPRTTTHTSKPS